MPIFKALKKVMLSLRKAKNMEVSGLEDNATSMDVRIGHHYSDHG